MTEDHDELLQHGMHVEIRQRFDRRWVRGFLVETVNAEGYEVRREHDGVLLPERFQAEDVRIEKRRFHFWRH
ncbi:MAG: hypothetical protein QOF21_1949 [Actinomycetota bacterium]